MSWAPFRSKSLSYHLRKLKAGYQFIENDAGKPMSLSPRQRRLVGWINRTANLKPYLRRARMAREAVALAPEAPVVADGYTTLTAIPGAKKAIQVCERQMEIYLDFLARGDEALRERRINVAAYRAEMAKTADDPLKHVPILYDEAVAAALVNFGLQPLLVAAAARHLGVLPVLSGLRLLYSPNAASPKLSSAQLYHMDPEGARQAKVFMAVRRVDKRNSPFTFLPAGKTLKVLGEKDDIYRSNRVPDKAMHKVITGDDLVKHMGKPGDALIVDTSQCLHYGSRPNAEPRVLLYYSFHDPFSSFHPVRYPAEKASRRWDFFRKTPHRFTDYLLSRRM